MTVSCDGTRYGGTSRFAPRTFYRHHVQHISMAAAVGDVQGLHKAVLNHKTRLCNGKGAPAGAGGRVRGLSATPGADG